jgi:hypothetical protein
MNRYFLKYFILLVCIHFGKFDVHAQRKANLWLPEKLVHTYMADSSEARLIEKNYPIQAMVLPLSKLVVITYYGEAFPVKTKHINRSGKYQIFNIPYTLNLMVYSKEYVDSMGALKFYISKIDEKLLLEIAGKDKTDSLYYIDRYKDDVFNDLYDAIPYLFQKK